MTDRTVSVSLGYTANPGNFESIRVNIEYGEVLRDGETHEEVANRVYEEVEAMLVEKAKETFDSLTGKAKRETTIRPA